MAAATACGPVAGSVDNFVDIGTVKTGWPAWMLASRLAARKRVFTKKPYESMI